jgi:hypothetical protein
MATMAVAGLAAAGVLGVEGAALVAVGLGAMATDYFMADMMSPEMPDAAPQQLAPIDKTALQKEGDLGKLRLGENDKKKKRAKGKKQFKIDLDSPKSDGITESAATAPKPEQTGVQL